MYKSFCRLDFEPSDWMVEVVGFAVVVILVDVVGANAGDNVDSGAINGKAIGDGDGVDELIIECDPSAVGFDNDVINR